MKLHRRLLTLATILGCAWLAGDTVVAAQDEMSTTVLTGGAEIYHIEAVRYGDVFPEGSEADGDDPVLMFESRKPEMPIRREVVPGTEGATREMSPHLLMDAETDTLYMVWETRLNSLHSRLHLVSRSPDGWSELLEVASGNPYLFKSNLQMAATRDTFTVQEEDGETSHKRVVLHLIWTEQVSQTTQEVLYSPVILLDGQYIGWNPVYSLSEMTAPALQDVPQSLVESTYPPTIHSGLQAHSVVVGFQDSTTGRLVSLDLELVSGELSFMGDAARAQLIEIGMRGNPTELADRARAQLIEIGHRFNPLLVQYLAEELHRFILERGPLSTDIESLADLARAQLIEIGVRFREGLGPAQDAARAQLIEIGHRFELNRARHDLKSSLREHFLAPETPTSQPVTLFVSDDGHGMLLMWETEDQKIWYRETGKTGWSSPQALQLGPELDRHQAYQLLEARVQNR